MERKFEQLLSEREAAEASRKEQIEFRQIADEVSRAADQRISELNQRIITLEEEIERRHPAGSRETFRVDWPE